MIKVTNYVDVETLRALMEYQMSENCVRSMRRMKSFELKTWNYRISFNLHYVDLDRKQVEVQVKREDIMVEEELWKWR
ncbi:hypothetical protein QYF36_005707 [Acer negundo]|nr:hypothetical protein QYF36_005707 [Acer negundo]